MVENLLRRPKKDKGQNRPTMTKITEENAIHQADLLFLPADHGFRYALVVVDVATGLTDAEPIKMKTAGAVRKAFEKIYARGVLDVPMRLEVDSGGEFKNEMNDYLKDEEIWVRRGKPDRHQQQSLVERRNRTIGEMLFKRMTAQEILTGESDPRWISELSSVIEEINKQQKKKKKQPDPLEGSPRCEGDVCKLLEEGTRVRVALEAPIDVATGKKAHGRFRATDVRWHPEPRVIERVVLAPNQPPRYLVGYPNSDKVERVLYTRNQLQVIPENEKAPSRTVLRGKKFKTFKVEPSD